MAADRTPNALRRRNWKEPMSEHTGGTVTYHRAKYRPGTDEPWLVWFTEDQADPYWFTAEQGEAMGLTPPEPAPLVVTCNGHSIELSDEEARAFVQEWDLHGDREDFFMLSNHDLACDALAGLLRDARQDPQPASEPWPWGDEGFMCPKMVRETLCVAQAAVGRSLEVDARRVEHVERISRLINLCDRHRPLGPDGKHGTRQCTPTCGCEDKREPTTPVEPAVEPDTSDTLDFDAMPIGTVLWDSRDFLLRLPGGWTYNPPADENDYYDIENDGEPFTVVYQPAPVSPAEGLRAVMAGRDDADELIEYASKHWNYVDESDAVCIVLGAVGDAARSGGAT